VVVWEARDDETPFDPSGLRRRGEIRDRRELAAAEARNINRAVRKYLVSRPSVRSARFDYTWALKLHREMFGEVWTWAGKPRTRDLNLGDPHHRIRERLAALIADLHSWSDYGHPIELQAVWLHHRAVQIHPFLNGNGRWSRLLANIWLRQNGAPIVEWPDGSLGEAGEARAEYIAAVKAADDGDYDPLLAFHRRHRMSD